MRLTVHRRNSWRWQWLFALLLIGAPWSLAQAADGVCSSRTAAAGAWALPPALSGQVMALSHADPTLTAEDIAALPDSAFKPVAPPLAGSGGVRPLWLRICLQRTPDSDPDWVLVIADSQIDDVQLAKIEGGHMQVQRTGAALPFGTRAIPAPGFAFALRIDAQSPTVAHLRLQSADNFVLAPSVASPWVFAANKTRNACLYGLYLGLIAMAAIINAVFWWRLRQAVHGLYAMDMLCMFIFSLILNGYGAYLLPDAPVLLQRALGPAYFASSVFFILFVVVALRMRLYYPRARKILLTIAVIFTLTIPIAAIDWRLPYLTWGGYLVLIGIAVFMPTSLHALRHHGGVRLYVVAMLPLEAAIALVILGLAGLPIGRYAMEQDWPTAAMLVHLVLLNTVLAQRAWNARRARERAQAAALRTTRRSEQELARRVAERTRALDRANGALQAQAAEREQARLRLAQALQTQSDLLALVTHEFRGPLATLSLATQALADRARPEDACTRDRITRMQRGVNHMAALVDNCLADARLRMGQQLAHAETTDLRATVQAATQHVSAERLHLVQPDQPVLVRHDRWLLGLAIANLVSNALKYSRSGALVRVCLSVHATTAEITVCNPGPGIAPDDRARIFERFYRGAGTRGIRGLGLGLYLCRELVVRHGGSLELLPDQHVGAECDVCFRMRLPCAGATEQT